MCQVRVFRNPPSRFAVLGLALLYPISAYLSSWLGFWRLDLFHIEIYFFDLESRFFWGGRLFRGQLYPWGKFVPRVEFLLLGWVFVT